jgi:hypothetical protein
MDEARGLETIAAMADCLVPQDKIRLIERVASALERELVTTRLTQRRSLYGWCADLGVAPSTEEIHEVRRAMWGNFPREDVA